MATKRERCQLREEIRKLNTRLRIALEDYGCVGDSIPLSTDLPVNKNIYFRELLAKRQMLSKVLGILSLRAEAHFELLPYAQTSDTEETEGSKVQTFLKGLYSYFTDEGIRHSCDAATPKPFIEQRKEAKTCQSPAFSRNWFHCN